MTLSFGLKLIENQSCIHTVKHLSQYGKLSKISPTFHFLFSKKMCVIRAEIHKILVRIANREDPDQTASSEAV